MSVVIATSNGAFVVDLFLKSAPMCCFNFLKLCGLQFYTNSLFIEVIKDFYLRVGHLSDPDGKTIYSLLSAGQEFDVVDEISSSISHSANGLLSTCNSSPNHNNSNFFITLGADLSRFDGKRSIFGQISENFKVIESISQEYTDKSSRPYKNIRILSTIVIYDPFPDPPGYAELRSAFHPYPRINEIDRIEDGESISVVSEEKFKEEIEAFRASQHAALLEILGEIPDAEAKPSESTLFICKLHPATTEDAIKIVFSRFGEVRSVNLIKDRTTGKSLCYGFVDFIKPEAAERAFLQMQRAIIDGKRIIVDFSQSLRNPEAHVIQTSTSQAEGK